jgi:hypothetical protein
MELQTFVEALTTRFDHDAALQRRRVAASQIAQSYDIRPVSVVLLFTMPEMARLPLSERCSRAGITEEELFYCMSTSGFKRFMSDYKASLRDVIDLQSLNKLSDAVHRDRFIESKDSTREDLSVETSVLGSVGKAAASPVSINFYDEARRRLAVPSTTISIPQEDNT